MSMLRDRNFLLSKQIAESNWNPLSYTSKGTAIAKKKVSDVSPKYQKIFLFMADQKLGIKEIREILLEVSNYSTNHIIIILKYKLTPQALILLEHSKMKFEIFTFEEMSFNPTTHELVPKHILLNEKQKKEFNKNVKQDIASIRLNDRIARHFGAEIGDIFRIERANELYFRKVIEEDLKL